MIVLGIDTSALVCTAALIDGEKVLSSFSLGKERTHSETLLPGILELFQKGCLSLADVDVIALACGPGSFTGLRIGLATVKGLAVSRQIPCVPVSTLEALAYRFYGKEEELVLCPVMDARRGEFYNALFSLKNGKIERLCEDRAVSGDVLSKEISEYKNVFLLGDGAEKFHALFPESGTLSPENLRLQSGESVALLGAKEAMNQNTVPCEKLSPRYLRLPQAEREWLAKQSTH